MVVRLPSGPQGEVPTMSNRTRRRFQCAAVVAAGLVATAGLSLFAQTAGNRLPSAGLMLAAMAAAYSAAGVHCRRRCIGNVRIKASTSAGRSPGTSQSKASAGNTNSSATGM